MYYFPSPEKNFRNLRAKAAFGQYSRLSKDIKQQQSHPPAMGNYYIQIPVSTLGDKGTAGIDFSTLGEGLSMLKKCQHSKGSLYDQKKTQTAVERSKVGHKILF